RVRYGSIPASLSGDLSASVAPAPALRDGPKLIAFEQQLFSVTSRTTLIDRRFTLDFDGFGTRIGTTFEEGQPGSDHHWARSRQAQAKQRGKAGRMGSRPEIGASHDSSGRLSRTGAADVFLHLLVEQLQRQPAVAQHHVVELPHVEFGGQLLFGEG